MTRVAIADDHPVVLAGLQELLRAAGFEVVATARNGTDAVAMARRERPDVLILDLRMPALDGLGVLRELSQDDQRPRCVLLTAEAEGSEVARARALGAEALVLKESALEQLVECIHALVAGREWEQLPVPELNVPGLTPVAREALVLFAGGASLRQVTNRLGMSEPRMRGILQEIASGLGVQPDETSVCRASIALLGAEEPDAKLTAWLQERYGLTRREAAVAALLSSGLTNREIALRLGITLNTLKTHISSIHAKTDVPSTRRLLAVLSEARN